MLKPYTLLRSVLSLAQMEAYVFHPSNLRYITLNPFGVKVNPALSANLSKEIYNVVLSIRSFIDLIPPIPLPSLTLSFPGLLFNVGLMFQFSLIYDVIRLYSLPTQAVCLLLHAVARAHFYLMKSLFR